MSLTAILPLIFGGIAGGSNLSASIINREQSRGDIDRQNEYNSPINQLARLREAGFPMAAGFQGGVTAGSQSALPQTSGAAASNAIAGFISTAVQLKQLKLIDAQIAKTQEEGQSVAIDNQIKMLDPTAGEPLSYGARMARLQYETAGLHKDLLENSYDINSMEYKLRKELYDDGTLSQITRQQLESLIVSLGIARQTENKGRIMDSIIERMKTNGIGLFEALLMAFGMGQLGMGDLRFPNINTGTNYKEFHIYK